VTLEELSGNFPLSESFPALLLQLHGFESSSSIPFADFELCAWKYGDPAWFAGDIDAARGFAVFGKDPDGSLYAFWLYDGQSIATAPVVFLGSEGEDCNLVAGNLSDFISLLLCTDKSVGFASHWSHFEEPISPSERFVEFRRWAAETLRLSPSQKPMELVAAGRKHHPSFPRWLDSWRARRHAA
jgi:hypothetical protein